MAVYPTAALDLWNLLVVNIFGGFMPTVLCLMIVFMIIMGFMGKISMFSVLQYNFLFFIIMMWGYGYSLYLLPTTIALFIWAAFSWKGYIDRGG